MDKDERLRVFRCPCCGASLTYDGMAKSLHCASCENDFSPETLEQLDETDRDTSARSSYDWSHYEPRTFSAAESEGLCTYSCPNCAAEITGSTSMGATVCPYCGGAAVVEKQFDGGFRPDYVVPFRLDKQAAMACFEKAAAAAPFLPDEFKDRRKVEKMSGVYVPFWMFDCTCNAAVNFRAKRVTMWSDRNYDYVKTDYYRLFRKGHMAFTGVPVDASRKADDAYMDSLEPYDCSEAVDFNTAYLAGYFADKYDVSADDCRPRADERIEKSTKDALCAMTGGYAGVSEENASVSFSDGKIRYGLLPVWMLHLQYNGVSYAYAINGQTGKVVGSYPVCKRKRNRFFAGVFGIGVVVMTVATACFMLL